MSRVINLCLLYSVDVKKINGIIKLLRTKVPPDCQLCSLKEQVNFSESHSRNFLTLTGSFHLVIKAIRSNKLYIKLKFLIVMRPLREIITPAKASICQLLLGGVLKTSMEELHLWKDLVSSSVAGRAWQGSRARR